MDSKYNTFISAINDIKLIKMLYILIYAKNINIF